MSPAVASAADEVGARQLHLRLGGRHARAGASFGEFEVARVEARQHLSRLDRGAQIDAPLGHLARHAETEGGFDPRHDFARKQQCGFGGRFDDRRHADRADFLGPGGRFAARGEQPRSAESEQNHGRTCHIWPR
jgi:hypothetical protein